MSYKFEHLPENNLMYLELDEEITGEISDYLSQGLLAALEASSEKQAFMINIGPSFKMGFSEIVQSLADATMGNSAQLRHANIGQLVIVTQNELYIRTGQALGSSQYGSLDVSVVKTLDEAYDLLKIPND